MKLKIILGLIALFILSAFVLAGDYQVDENMNLLGNDVHNATNINGTNVYQDDNQVLDVSGIDGSNVTSGTVLETYLPSSLYTVALNGSKVDVGTIGESYLPSSLYTIALNGSKVDTGEVSSSYIEDAYIFNTGDTWEGNMNAGEYSLTNASNINHIKFISDGDSANAISIFNNLVSGDIVYFDDEEYNFGANCYDFSSVKPITLIGTGNTILRTSCVGSFLTIHSSQDDGFSKVEGFIIKSDIPQSNIGIEAYGIGGKYKRLILENFSTAIEVYKFGFSTVIDNFVIRDCYTGINMESNAVSISNGWIYPLNQTNCTGIIIGANDSSRGDGNVISNVVIEDVGSHSEATGMIFKDGACNNKIEGWVEYLKYGVIIEDNANNNKFDLAGYLPSASAVYLDNGTQNIINFVDDIYEFRLKDIGLDFYNNLAMFNFDDNYIDISNNLQMTLVGSMNYSANAYFGKSMYQDNSTKLSMPDFNVSEITVLFDFSRPSGSLAASDSIFCSDYSEYCIYTIGTNAIGIISSVGDVSQSIGENFVDGKIYSIGISSNTTHSSLYVNNLLKGVLATGMGTHTDSDYAIGHKFDGGVNFCDGCEIDNLIVINKSLNSSEMNTYFTHRKPNIDLNGLLGKSDESSLKVSESDYWDGLNTPSDINAGDITNDGTYRLESWNNRTGIPHATPSNGDLTHFSLADEVYDFVIALGYAALNSAVTFTTVDTGQGANELYFMNQDVGSANNTVFNRMTATTEISGAQNWSDNQNYPAACSSGYAVTQLGDSATCTDSWVNTAGDTWSGDMNAGNNKLSDVLLNWTSPLSDYNRILYLPMNKNADDYSGEGNDGSVSNALLADGKMGQGYSFDGNDSIDIASITLESGTVSMWIQVNQHTGGSNNYFLDWWGGSYNRDSIRILTQATGFVVKIYDNASNNNQFEYTWSIPTDWVYTSVSFNSTQASFYIDGEHKQTTVFPDVFLSQTDNMRLGSVNSGSSDYLNGTMDDVMIYNRSLSADEIKAIYSQSAEFYGGEAYLLKSGGTISGELEITGVSGAGKAVCVKADGDLGTCTDAVNATGYCTCT